jgi:hypothetical protein
MKRIVCAALLFSLAAPAAFAKEGGILGMQVYFRSAGADADSAALADLITRALDKSRVLHLVPTPDDEDTMEVQAPISMITEGGKRVKMTYEVTPPKGGTARVYTATCTTTQLDRCADAVAIRVERIAREIEMGGLPLS